VKFELPKNSLFAILLRSKWWVSVLLGGGIFFLVRIWFHPGVALFAAAPFLGIGVYAAWKQLKRPSEKRIARTLERARALPLDGFCAALEEGFRREGYEAQRAEGKNEQGADIILNHRGMVALVACKRWKAKHTGIEPLREFDAATRERGATIRMYVAVGEVTDTARAFAHEKQIRLLQEEDLARLLRL
jgi:restriction system protein